MSQLVKKGKLYVDILFKPEVMKSFEMHRDIKSCIQLTEAEEILSKRQQEFLHQGNTAVLQFLNSYPLSFNHKILVISLRIYSILKKMEGLKGYEQQLRYGLYSKLREYLGSEQQRKMMVTNIQEEQKIILQQIKVEPYDIVHSINFLFLQKEGLKSEIFYHCIDVLRNTDYKILESSLPKITPMLLRRLHLSEWGYLRQFTHFLNFLVYDYQPLKEASIKLGILNLLPIAQLQLHRIGYSKIPRCIDEVIKQVCHNLESDNNLDTAVIQTTFWAFKHLPINYNQKGFRLLYVKLLERVGQNKRVFHANKLPFIRMKFNEIKEIYQKHFNSVDLFSQMPYIGNDLEARLWMRKTGVINKLLKQYKKLKQVRQKHYSVNIIICHLLLQEFENNKEEVKQIEQKYLQVVSNIEQNNTHNFLFKALSLCHIFQIEQITNKLNLKYSKRRYDYYFQEFIKRQFQFDQIQFMDNIHEAIYMFHNTNVKTIIQWINIIISKVLFGNLNFNFKFFSQYIFLLEKSKNSDAFISAKEMVYSRLQPQDSPYLVQLYLRFPNKTIKGHINFITKIWQKQNSFKSLGKFLTMSNYGLFSSPRGQLNLKIKSILQAIQPSLNQQDVAFFMIDQYISILRFLHHFRSFLPTFSSKFLNIVLNVVEKMVISKEQSKQMLVFLEECILLNIESVISAQNSQRILKILLNLKQNLKQTMFMKCKQMQMRWMLGFTEDAEKIALAVQQILQNILNSNNSAKKIQIILILLKLYTFQIIDLSKKMSLQLAKFAITALNEDNKNVKEVISTIHLISKQNSRLINPKNAQNLLMVIKSAVKSIKTKHNFQYYSRLIQLAKQSRDKELLKLCFDQLFVFDIKMYPSQIKKILHILKYYPFIQVNNFREKIIKEVYNFIDYLQDQLPDILYTVHTLRDIVPKHQVQIYQKLFQRSQQFLIQKITISSEFQKCQTSTDAKKDLLLLMVLKNLWVSVKINQYSSQSLRLFQFVKEQHAELIKMKELQGLTWEYIYYIHYVFEIKSKSNQSKKNLQKKLEPQKKFFFKSKNTIKQEQTQLFKNQKKLKTLFKMNSCAIQKEIAQSLEKLGLENINRDKIAPNKKNFYICNYQIKGITLPIFLNKQDSKYGLIILSDRKFFNDRQEKRGKVQFLVNAYTVIAQIPMFAIMPTENIPVQ